MRHRISRSFLTFALGPASLSGSGASCDGVRDLFELSFGQSRGHFIRLHESIPRCEWSMLGPQRQPERVAPTYEPPTVAAAPMVCFLCPVGWVPPGSLSRRVSQPGGLYIPRQQTVTFHSEGCRFRRSARRRQRCAGPPDARGRERPRSKLLLAGDDGCLFHRDGGPVTTILSREGRSPRMTFRM